MPFPRWFPFLLTTPYLGTQSTTHAHRLHTGSARRRELKMGPELSVARDGSLAGPAQGVVRRALLGVTGARRDGERRLFRLEFRPLAGVVQWQNGSFPSCIRGFDSLRPLHDRLWLRVPSAGRPVNMNLSQPDVAAARQDSG